MTTTMRPTGRLTGRLTRRLAASAAFLAIALAAAAPALRAAESGGIVREGQGVVTELGPDASAISYWTKAPDGWHEVTTVDMITGRDSDAERHAIVRFSAILLPGQSQLISIPVAIGSPQQVLRIRRIGNRIEMERVSGPST